MERIDITNAGDVFIIKWILSRNRNTPPVRVRVSVNDDDDERPYLSAATATLLLGTSLRTLLYPSRTSLELLCSWTTARRLLASSPFHLILAAAAGAEWHQRRLEQPMYKHD